MRRASTAAAGLGPIISFAVPDERIFGRTNTCRNVPPAQSLLAEFQSAVGIDFNSRPSKADAAPFGRLLPRYDTLADRAPFQFRDRCKNREHHLARRRRCVDSLTQANEVNGKRLELF